MDVPITLKIRPSSGSITGTRNICDGKEVSFRTSAISFARKYIWQISGPGVGYDFETNVPDTAFTYKLPVSWPQGNYTVSVFGRNPQCYDGEKIAYQLFVHDPPQAGFTFTNPCQGAEITFTSQSVASDFNLSRFSWTVTSGTGNKRTYAGNPVIFVFDTVANYQFSHIVTDLLGCSDTAYSIIALQPKPEISFQYTLDPVVNGELYFINQSTGAIDYSWDFGNGISSSLIEPVIRYDREGNYGIVLTAINQEGCIDTAVRYYYYMPGLWMPNAFTPDNNGNNDVFKPVTQRNTLEPYKLLIFNRWGELIFESSDPEKGWDGKINGEPCPAGRYSYFLQYREGIIESDQILTQRGMVSLIR
jgi:gliding motility-associated-like protein